MINPAEQFKIEMPDHPLQGQAFEVYFSANSESPYFNGHFPGDPVLPAVAMVDACLLILSRAFPELRPELQRIVSSKFLNKISPDQKVMIRVEPRNTSWAFHWLEPGAKSPLAQVELAIAAPSP